MSVDSHLMVGVSYRRRFTRGSFTWYYKISPFIPSFTGVLCSTIRHALDRIKHNIENSRKRSQKGAEHDQPEQTKLCCLELVGKERYLHDPCRRSWYGCGCFVTTGPTSPSALQQEHTNVLYR